MCLLAFQSNSTDYEIGFTPAQVPESTFIDQIQTLQSQGRKVLLSIGGANDPIKLDNSTEKNVFISSLNDLISTYGLMALILTLREVHSLSVEGPSLQSTDPNHTIHLIDTIKSIMLEYQLNNSKKLLLTFAPETAFVQGGQSAWSGIWGAYLPVLHALRDSLDLVHVQLYNSGSMYGIDGNIYSQGNRRFHYCHDGSGHPGDLTAGLWSSGPAHLLDFLRQKNCSGPACLSGGCRWWVVDTPTIGRLYGTFLELAPNQEIIP
ncbi:MAG: hypothetical protein IPJ06_05620 [Saprospiraceae bacterium]|nr:hypothetical protein [Saprospiraceae bacterium]